MLLDAEADLRLTLLQFRAFLSYSFCVIRHMVEYQVLLSGAGVEIVSKEKATQIIAQPDNPALVAVRQDFSGPFSGVPS